MITIEPSDNKTSSNSIWLLLLGFFLIGSYFIISSILDGFIDPYINYKNIYNMIPLGNLQRAYYANDFTKHTLLSNVWKMLVLFPGTLALCLYFAKKISKEQTDSILNSLNKIKPRPLLIFIFVSLILLQMFSAFLIFNDQPIYDDERTYDFQARIITTGKFYAPVPPGEECFRNTFIILKDGKWLGKYTSGQPILLALGYKLGSRRIILFLMAALTPLLVYLIGKLQYGEKVGMLAAFLFVISPFYLFVSSTIMNHSTSLFFFALFTYTYLKSKPGCSIIYPIIAGLSIGYALNIRPQCAVGYGLPFAVWSIIKIISDKDRGKTIKTQLIILLSFAVPLAFLLYYNKHITGDYFQFPFNYQNAKAYYGFKPNPTSNDLHHNSFMGIFNLFVNILRMNADLFGWSFSLIFFFFFFIIGKFQKEDRIFLGVILSVCCVYFFYPGPGVNEIGARYYFSLLIPIMLFTSKSIFYIHDFLKKYFLKENFQANIFIPAFIFLSFVFSVFSFYGERSIHYMNLTDKIGSPYKFVENTGLHNAIIRVESIPATGWVFSIVNNNPDLKDDIIYTWISQPQSLLELWNNQPNRKVYRLKYNSNDVNNPFILKEITKDELIKAVEINKKKK